MRIKKPAINSATRLRIAASMAVAMTLALGILKVTAPLQHQLA